MADKSAETRSPPGLADRTLRGYSLRCVRLGVEICHKAASEAAALVRAAFDESASRAFARFCLSRRIGCCLTGRVPTFRPVNDPSKSCFQCRWSTGLGTALVAISFVCLSVGGFSNPCTVVCFYPQALQFAIG